jgi:hypothetical protein
MQIHELEELTQHTSGRKKKTKPDAVRTTVLDRELLKNNN